ncbi:hypothetical protein PG990_014432 [Apiospora arundinis]|uniref:Uncharacterized protein n=1 Tax=Apiospora arundinis TaxID=335852 RepID=A0ABR2I7J1_9PEZI
MPFPLYDMLKTIDSFPPMRPDITYADLINIHGGFSWYKRREVLKWLCSTFRGMIVPTPPSDKVKFDMPLPSPVRVIQASFIFLNSHPERESQFKQQLKDHNNSTGGVAAFHGASLHNTFNILCDRANQHRNPGGKIFYSKEPSVAAFYAWRSLSPEQSQISGQGWTNSMFKCHSMMFGLEVAEQAEFYGVDHEANSHQERLMVHHIFALSPAAEETYRDVYGHKYWVQNRSPRPQMEETFRRIHDGRLLREVSEGQRDHGGVLARGRDSSIFTQRASEVLMLNLQFRLYVT